MYVITTLNFAETSNCFVCLLSNICYCVSLVSKSMVYCKHYNPISLDIVCKTNVNIKSQSFDYIGDTKFDVQKLVKIELFKCATEVAKNKSTGAFNIKFCVYTGQNSISNNEMVYCGEFM